MATTTIQSFKALQFVSLNSHYKSCFPFWVGNLCSGKFPKLCDHSSPVRFCCSAKSSGKNGCLSASKKGLTVTSIDGENEEENVEKLKPLWDDGYGSVSVKDYVDGVKDLIVRSDDGPPRWFCPVECGSPLKDSPVLMYLPGMDGLGMGLIRHHKALGKVFEVRCMHIPVYDRTPFEELVEFIENAVRTEYASSKKPIYIVAESFGGCLALSVAARNPTIDLILILVNPATSFSRSQLQPVLPYLKAFPDEFHKFIPHLLSFTFADPFKMAMLNIDRYDPSRKLVQLSDNLGTLQSLLSVLADIMPKETLLWKLKMLEAGDAYTNARLHAVKAEVLVLASGKDKMLPSRDEAPRLKSSIENCIVRYFHDNGHILLMEDGINLLTVLKGTCQYRRSVRRDFISDFLPPSMSEFKVTFDQYFGFYHRATSPVMFSTMKDGTIVRGLAGVPNEGPVILVGYHTLFGADIASLIGEFLREKNVMVHGLAHPNMFAPDFGSYFGEFSSFDVFKVFGPIPVTPSNFYRLLSNKSYALLYPGGVREAIHNKGENYKLFWPDQPEFVRMAAKFGATIIPFGTVGEDDLIELFFDYNDMTRLSILKDLIKGKSTDAARPRTEVNGEAGKQHFFVPGFHPKLPGRFYFLFGKPIETKGKEELLTNRSFAKELYFQIKSEVEQCIAYLIKKREEDPYRHIVQRELYRAISSSPNHVVPSFDP